MQSPVRVRRIRMTSSQGEDESSVVVGGGHSVPEAPPLPRVPLESLPWSFLPSRSKYAQRPRLRQGSSGGVVDGVLYLFGGFEDNGHRSNGLVQYDMTAHTWSDVECFGKIPAPRYGHACCLYDHQLWCFGGQGPEEGLNHKNILGDLSILDLRTREWRRGVVSCAGSQGHVTFLPLPRRGHSLVVHNHSLFLYAGAGPDRIYGKDAYFGDLQRLDLDSMCWHEPAMSGVLPAPRSQHAALVHDTMVVFGGQSSAPKKSSLSQLMSLGRPTSLKEIVVDRKSLQVEMAPRDTGFASNALHLLDLLTFTWTSPPLAGMPPAPRYGHVMVAHPQNPLCLFLFGGITEHGGYQDTTVHCVDLELHRWSTLAGLLDPMPPRTRHAMFAHGCEMMIFGGCGAEGLCVGDVFTIKLPDITPPTPTALKRLAQDPPPPKVSPTRPQTMSMATKPFSAKPTRGTISISPIKAARSSTMRESPWTAVGLPQ
ncbi:Aste57867_10515 [Aphanomyces stellatus]|uniref:Aste57867_10515 protein n=1 Tax=Aphanomyces stellatus TaxID=120398 RepID=A0A485KQL2_9STRA|nr:hypothetical protein As57867_010475 [Aphanomyces stellatus]VFT87388.1 Aste57867_10515 [Aphanomyces stellatus]